MYRRHLGGKLGEQVQKLLNIHNVGQLRGFPKEVLQKHFGEKSGYGVCGDGVCEDGVCGDGLTLS